MSSQARSAAARRGAKLRARRAAYCPERPRRSDEMLEAEREARGELTLRARRGNLPSWKNIRGKLTHEDAEGRGYYVADDAFGVVLRKAAQQPPENGELVELEPLAKDGEKLTYALYNPPRYVLEPFRRACVPPRAARRRSPARQVSPPRARRCAPGAPKAGGAPSAPKPGAPQLYMMYT